MLALFTSLVVALSGPFLSADRLVFPQAAVGPYGGQTFAIELRLANRNLNEPLGCTIRLLAQQDLTGMPGLIVTSADIPVDSSFGSWEVEVPAGGSVGFKVSSDELQIGVLSVETAASRGRDLVTSFLYRLLSGERGADLISMQPVREPALSFNSVIARETGLSVGLALVSEAALSAASASTPIPETPVTLTAFTADGESHRYELRLGGTEAAQKAIFPEQLIPGLAGEFEAARLNISAASPVYLTLLNVGAPPYFEDVQLGPAPADVEAAISFRSPEDWVIADGGSDLLTGHRWECSGAGVRSYPGGIRSAGGTGWTTSIHSDGPQIEVSGNLAVVTSLYAADGSDGSITLVGRPASGPEWWQGLVRLDLGIEQGRVTATGWNNSSTPVFQEVFLDPGTLSGKTEIRLEAEGDRFRAYSDRNYLGQFGGLPLLASGRVLLGTNVPPQQEMTVFGIGVEAPSESAVRVVPPVQERSVETLPDSLRSAAENRDLSIGAAAVPDLIRSETEYRELLGGHFNMLTAENVMKWTHIHPERERYDFCPGDSLVEFARANGMKVRGHTLVWHRQNPNWLTGGSFDPETLKAILREHIFEVAGHYRGRIAEWDVLNEALDDDGTLRDTLWLEALGPEYIDLVFRWAREADPSTLLFYNDYSIEGLGAKSDALYQLVRGMLERGVPIDGIGFQAHLGTEPWLHPGRQSIAANLRRFAELGLRTSFTEVDVRLKLPVGPEMLEDQADLYGDLLQICLDEPSCRTFVMWGFTDRHSWIPGVFTGYGAALPYDEAYQPKPAFDRLLEVLGPSGASDKPAPSDRSDRSEASDPLAPAVDL